MRNCTRIKNFLFLLIIFFQSCANKKFIRESLDNDYNVYQYFSQNRAQLLNTLQFNYNWRGAHSFTFIDSVSREKYASVKISMDDTFLYNNSNIYSLSSPNDSTITILKNFNYEIETAKLYSKIFEKINWYYSDHDCIDFEYGKINSKNIAINISGLHFNAKGALASNSCTGDLQIDDNWFYKISDKWDKAESNYFIKMAKRKFKIKEN